jgi:acetyl esterase/lipase
MKFILLIVGALALGLFLFTRLVAPPHQLDLINNLTLGDRGAEIVAEGVVFDPRTGLKLDVWARQGADKTPKPVLIFFYGGGWANGAREHYGFVARAYAAKGFVVVLPDYRKVPQVRFPAFNEDGALAVKWVRDSIRQYGGDPKRITLAGHSAGAYIAMMLTLDAHYLSAVGVDPAIIRATAGLAGPYDFYPYDSRRSVDAMARWPDPHATQPIHFARADAAPIWLGTGTEDDTVKPRNAILLAQRLKALGVTREFRAYQGLSHEDLIMAVSSVFRSKGRVLDDSAAFLLDHAKPIPQ